jgi:hypothetical protein
MTAVNESAERPGLVARAKNIILTPGAEWERIDREPATIKGIYLGYVAPLAAIPAIFGLIGALVFGYGAFGITFRPSPVSAVVGALVGYGLTLAAVFVLALIIDALAPTFQGQKNQVQAFKTAAYAYTASWLAGVFNIHPAMAILTLLGLYSLFLLYKGLPRLMKAPEDKALPYTGLVVLAAVVMALVIGMVTAPLMRMGGAMGVAGGGAVSGEVRLPGGASVDLGELEAAAKRMESGEAVEPIAGAALGALLPADLAGWTRTETSSGSGGAAGLSGSGAKSVFTAGDSRLELSVTDLGGMGALAGLGGALNIEANEETATGYERVGKVNGRMTTEKYDRTDRSGTYGFLVGERFMVQAEGRGVTMDQLKAAAGSVDLRRVEALAKR